MQFKQHMVAVLAASALTGAAQAALVNRGGGMIYDTTRNITWMADMNYARTSGYAGADSVGRMNWDAAMQWADQLVFGGYDDWRLPTMDPLDPTCSDTNLAGIGLPLQHVGYHCTGGELSGLFVTEFGAREGWLLDPNDETPEQIANLALFKNIRNFAYWSSTPYDPAPTVAFAFLPGSGRQTTLGKFSTVYAVAVRNGDVAASVPEPQTLGLLLLGLAAAAIVRCRPSR